MAAINNTVARNFEALNEYLNSYAGSKNAIKLFMVSVTPTDAKVWPMTFVRSEIKELLPGDDSANNTYLVLYNEDGAGLYINKEDFQNPFATLVNRTANKTTLHIFEDDAYKTVLGAYMDMEAKILAHRLELKSQLDELDLASYDLHSKMAECHRIIANV